MNDSDTTRVCSTSYVIMLLLNTLFVHSCQLILAIIIAGNSDVCSVSLSCCVVGLCEWEELQHSSMVARTSRVFCGVCVCVDGWVGVSVSVNEVCVCGCECECECEWGVGGGRGWNKIMKIVRTVLLTRVYIGYPSLPFSWNIAGFYSMQPCGHTPI